MKTAYFTEQQPAGHWVCSSVYVMPLRSGYKQNAAVQVIILMMIGHKCATCDVTSRTVAQQQFLLIMSLNLFMHNNSNKYACSNNFIGDGGDSADPLTVQLRRRVVA